MSGFWQAPVGFSDRGPGRGPFDALVRWQTADGDVREAEVVGAMDCEDARRKAGVGYAKASAVFPKAVAA